MSMLRQHRLAPIYKEVLLSITDRSKADVCCVFSMLDLLCPCVYGLEQYDHLNNSDLFCFLFCFVILNRN